MYTVSLILCVADYMMCRLLDTYRRMKEEGHCPKLDVILLVLRGISYDDDRYMHSHITIALHAFNSTCMYRILQLLDDSKHCHSTTIDIARSLP